MQRTRLHDDVFFEILWDEKTEIIGIQWKEATASMTEPGPHPSFGFGMSSGSGPQPSLMPRETPDSGAEGS